MKNAWALLAAVCALVIGVYAFAAHSGLVTSTEPNATDNYYNLLVQGFRAGQLSLKKEVPPGFAQLADPYDPSANAVYGVAPYRLHDLSYYKGRLYLYFGVTPAVILLWPFVVVTGHYLYSGQAAAFFCVMGFLAGAGVLRALWRRYFSEVSVWVVAAGTLALGLGTGVPVMWARSEVYEVAVSCGYMLTMLSLGGIWCALHETDRRCWWLAAASAAYGLAVGARPSLLFGAVVLLVPVAQSWRGRQQMWRLLVAATVPITVIGLGLMLYNELRFDSPFEFGQHYQLAGYRPIGRQFFHWRYLWFNLRVYFWGPVRWSTRFPFVREISVPPFPSGYDRVETAFGVLTGIPLVWLALAVPLAWRSRSGPEASTLRWFVTGVALLFGACVLPLLFYQGATIRYEVEFLPTLVLLAAVGILGLDRALADRRIWRRAARCGWGLLLGFSVALNLLLIVERCAEAHYNVGVALGQAGRIEEAVAQYKQALRFNPDYAAAHCNLGNALAQTGKIEEAIAHYEQALRIKPDYAEAHNDLGTALAQTGKIEEAIAHYEQALRINPDFALTHYNFGVALLGLGKVPEAVEEYEQALRIKPDYPEAHNNLGTALYQMGQVQDAIGHYEEALRIRPDYAKAHYNLGLALWQAGQLRGAIGHYEQALRINPDFTEVHVNLGIALSQVGSNQDALAHFMEALRLRPDSPEVHRNLGQALFQTGRVQDAINHYEQALRINPDYAETHFNLGLALEKLGRTAEAIEHYQQALKLQPDFAQARNALARLQAGR
jgi:tetratricopeptide (TPR) repeat protein